MITGQKKVVKGDRGMGIHSVEIIERCLDLEKAEYQKTGARKEIWKAKKSTGVIVYIFRTHPSQMFQIDPFLRPS